MEVYGKDEATMKPLLGSVSMPAGGGAAQAVGPGPGAVARGGRSEAAGPAQGGERAGRTARRHAQGGGISTIPMDSAASLEAGEKAAAEASCGFARADLKILAQNREIAKDKEVPEAEARGIEECNEWRMLVGLNALLLDPKLCEAARDHSKDMQEQGFFAHESPVGGQVDPLGPGQEFRHLRLRGEHLHGQRRPGGRQQRLVFLTRTSQEHVRCRQASHRPGLHRQPLDPDVRRLTRNGRAVRPRAARLSAGWRYMLTGSHSLA